MNLNESLMLIPFYAVGFRDDSEDGESETRDSFSDSYSDESESDKLSRCASDEGFEHDAFLHPNDRLGYLYLQHFERSAPYARVPLMDKVTTQSCSSFPTSILSFKTWETWNEMILVSDQWIGSKVSGINVVEKRRSFSSKLDGCSLVSDLPYSYGKDNQRFVHLFPHLSHSFIFFPRYY